MIMVDPVVLGGGTPMFEGLKNNLKLKLTDSKKLKSGAVMNTYSRVEE
jgi:dihydrofolate reductase